MGESLRLATHWPENYPRVRNKWGQININFQSKGAEANGGFLMVAYHKSSAPISLCPF